MTTRSIFDLSRVLKTALQGFQVLPSCTQTHEKASKKIFLLAKFTYSSVKWTIRNIFDDLSSYHVFWTLQGFQILYSKSQKYLRWYTISLYIIHMFSFSNEWNIAHPFIMKHYLEIHDHWALTSYVLDNRRDILSVFLGQSRT